ncbi:MAG: hypothetical protein ACKVS6_10480, partial [Planctomycetota bacterium]
MNTKSIVTIAMCCCAAVGVQCAPSAPSAPSAAALVTGPKRSAKELLAIQLLQEVIDEALRIPSVVQSNYPSLLGNSNTGTARILVRDRFPDIGKLRGGGAYYSFATLSNSYDDEPDLELDNRGYFRTSFVGGWGGFLLNVGKVDIETLDESGTKMPVGLKRDEWDIFFVDAHTTARDFDKTVASKANLLGLTNYLKADVGDSYLLRAILPG